MEKYVINWKSEAGWTILVAVVAQAAFILQETDIQEVLQDPEKWAIAFAAALGRVAFAAGKNVVLPRILGMLGGKAG